MPDEDPVNDDVIVPVLHEQLHVDAQPVVTGGVRVTKHVESTNEIVEQQLRTSHADIKRVKTNRVVDGPQPVQRNGNNLVIPVVSEVLHIERRWVVTEEIHITQRDEVETVRENVPVNYERAEIERLDESGNVTATENPPVERAQAAHVGQASRSLLTRTEPVGTTSEKPLSQKRSLLKDKGKR